MKVDNELLKEVKKANGDGTREARHALFRKLRECEAELENKKAFNYFTPETFGQIFKKHDRAIVAIVLASTIYRRQDRLERSTFLWALEILRQWTARPYSGVDAYALDDGLHPSRIEQYAGSFIRLTTLTE